MPNTILLLPHKTCKGLLRRWVAWRGGSGVVVVQRWAHDTHEALCWAVCSNVMPLPECRGTQSPQDAKLGSSTNNEHVTLYEVLLEEHNWSEREVTYVRLAECYCCKKLMRLQEGGEAPSNVQREVRKASILSSSVKEQVQGVDRGIHAHSIPHFDCFMTFFYPFAARRPESQRFANSLPTAKTVITFSTPSRIGVLLLYRARLIAPTLCNCGWAGIVTEGILSWGYSTVVKYRLGPGGRRRV